MARGVLKSDVKLTARTPADDIKATLGKKLIHACHYNQLERVKALIAQGADPAYKNLWGETPVYAAAGSCGTEVLEYLATLPSVTFDVKTLGNQTLLHNAIATGDVRIAEMVAQKNAPWAAQAYDGSTVLMIAVRSGHYQMVRWLLSKKDKQMIEKTDYSGWNALHHAVMPYRLNRRFDILEALIAGGVPLNAETYKEDTVLHLAARRGNTLVIAYLIEAGAKIGCHPCETGATTCAGVNKKIAQFMRQMRAQRKKREEEEGRNKPGFFASLFGKKQSKPVPITADTKDKGSVTPVYATPPSSPTIAVTPPAASSVPPSPAGGSPPSNLATDSAPGTPSARSSLDAKPRSSDEQPPPLQMTKTPKRREHKEKEKEQDEEKEKDKEKRRHNRQGSIYKESDVKEKKEKKAKKEKERKEKKDKEEKQKNGDEEKLSA